MTGYGLEYYLNYFIIFLVIALMIAPIFWIMPSPRQKRQTQMRQQAMAMGFQIKIAPLPQTHRDTVRQVDTLPGVVYRLPWANGRPVREPFLHVLVRNDSRQSAATSAINSVLVSALAALPEDVEAIEYASSGVAIYWREQGGIERLAALHQQLVDIRAQLLPFNPQ
jgi:ABC-type glycerol-3-phosphate transport system permease component